MGRVNAIGKDKDSGKPDATMIWWDARPRSDLGTLEIRIADMCTTIDEAICIAAFIQTLAAFLIKLREQNQSFRVYRSKMIEENKWRAMRYGIQGKFIDFGEAKEVPAHLMMREIVKALGEVASELGTQEELAYIHTILDKGTSADRQLATYRRSIADGCGDPEALRDVVDKLWLKPIRDCEKE